jgi:undecaprenyl-diphosphatase
MKKTHHTAELLPLSIAFYIGMFQCLAMIFPGTSRSGATILGAMALGVTRTASAEFSFFLAIPTLLAATSYKFLHLVAETSLTADDFIILGIGFVVSFFSGWAAIGFLMHYLRKYTLLPFGVYRIIIGLLVLWKCRFSSLLPLFLE